MLTLQNQSRARIAEMLSDLATGGDRSDRPAPLTEAACDLALRHTIEAQADQFNRVYMFGAICHQIDSERGITA